MLRAWRRSSKYELYCLWFDPTEARTQDLPYSREEKEVIRNVNEIKEGETIQWPKDRTNNDLQNTTQKTNNRAI